MIKFNSLIIFIPIFIFGCSPEVIDGKKVIQKIESLNMNIFSKGGSKIYSIISPNSKYDKVKLEFNLKKTTINILMEKTLNLLLMLIPQHY